MQILKLGGSVVTDKDQPFKPHTENIERLAREIAASAPQSLVIVHGGGSYGHPVAKKFSINEGYKSPDQILGFSKTHQAMIQLNHIIVDALLAAGVPAFSVSPSSFIVTEKKRITTLDLSIVIKLLDSGMVPVLYGDAVLDSHQRFAILSGDQLIVKLAKYLDAKRVILGSDVDGVYTADPKLVETAELLRVLPISDVTGKVKIGEALSTDVTGGMLGKIMEVSEAAKAGVDVILLNACEPGRVQAALRGEKVIGTTLTR
ncbi:MAG: isopentenyl phosphate kinase [Candidatus Bathyarchaeota archaeon]|nr:isopentenyl phosphate kinase [Candidatus Bathyarchaeota archaeon]